MANVTFGFNPVPSPACYPPDLNGLAEELTTGGILSGTIPDSAGGGIFVGSVPPSSSLTNKVWCKTDSAGRPLGVYMFYNGNWRKVYSGTAPGEIRLWSGTNSVFDGTGLAPVGGDLDGWALCNGNNGTPDLHDRFIVASANYVGYWETFVNPAGASQEGGSSQVTLQATNLPPLQTSGITAQTLALKGSGMIPLAQIAGDNPSNFFVNGFPGAQPLNSTPFTTLPPYFALAYIMFVGYA